MSVCSEMTSHVLFSTSYSNFISITGWNRTHKEDYEVILWFFSTETVVQEMKGQISYDMSRVAYLIKRGLRLFLRGKFSYYLVPQ